MTVAFRPMIADDRDFVRSGWSSSYRTSLYAGLILMEDYAAIMHFTIDRIFDRPSTTIIVAHEPGEVDYEGRPFLYGFIAIRTDLPQPYVYYVFVKNAYRRGRARHHLELGHATALFAAAGIDPSRPFGCACWTSVCDQLVSKIPLATFTTLPGRFERPEHEQRQDRIATQASSRSIR